MGKSCPVPDGADDYKDVGTAHTPMLYIAGIATLVTLGISVSLIYAHLRRYRCPKEQRQIIRISFAPFVFALVSFFEIVSYRIAPYIDPIGDFYEAFGLCALFLLYLQYAAPGGTFDQETFEAVRAAEEGDKKTKFDWPRIGWILVFQYPVTELLAIIILEATEAAGTYCLQSLNPKYGHLWYEIIQSIGVGLAVLAIITFYGRMKGRMKVSRGLAKLVCFKIIVGVRFAQSLIFSLLLNRNVIKPGKTFTYNDILYGLESVITSVEMAIFALGFWYCYSSTEYSSAAKPQQHRLPVLKAVLDAINPWELIVGIGRIFHLGSHLKRTGGFKEWSAATSEGVSGKIGRKIGRGQGRYQTADGMQSLPRPSAAHGQSDSRYNDNYPMLEATGQSIYQPPSGSPPSYENTHLVSEPQDMSYHGGPGWDGRRYDPSPSPADRIVGERGMV